MHRSMNATTFYYFPTPNAETMYAINESSVVELKKFKTSNTVLIKYTAELSSKA